MRFFSVLLVSACLALANGEVASSPLVRDATVASQANCRLLPGDPSWPSTREWAALNQTVNGRLIATQPVAHVCHGTDYNETACDVLKQNWDLPETQYAHTKSTCPHRRENLAWLTQRNPTVCSLPASLTHHIGKIRAAIPTLRYPSHVLWATMRPTPSVLAVRPMSLPDFSLRKKTTSDSRSRTRDTSE